MKTVRNSSFAILALVVVLLCATPVPAGARRLQPRDIAQALTVAVTFRLDVIGSPAPDITFWVAYGPLHGRFGLIRLHRSSAGQYSATKKLPAGAKARFSYIVGIGTVHTRLGDEPGGRAITIKTFNRRAITGGSLPTVHWQAPAG